MHSRSLSSSSVNNHNIHERDYVEELQEELIDGDDIEVDGEEEEDEELEEEVEEVPRNASAEGGDDQQQQQPEEGTNFDTSD